jgi:hypothetical protein
LVSRLTAAIAQRSYRRASRRARALGRASSV